MGVNSLPKTVSRHRRDCDLNPGPTAPESSTLTTWLPSHPQWLLRSFNCSYVYSDTLVISFLWNLFFQKGLSVFATFCVWYHVSITSLHLLTINLITCIEIYALSLWRSTFIARYALCISAFSPILWDWAALTTPWRWQYVLACQLLVVACSKKSVQFTGVFHAFLQHYFAMSANTYKLSNLIESLSAYSQYRVTLTPFNVGFGDGLLCVGSLMYMYSTFLRPH